MPIQLSEKELNILAHAALQADASIGIIAKDSGYRAHSVRRTLDRLLRLEVIRPVAMLNPYSLGFTDYYTLFAIENDSRLQRKALEILMKAPEVFWLAETGANFQFSSSILARSPAELSEILGRLSGQLGHSVREKSVAICHEMYLVAPTPLNGRKLTVPSVSYYDVGSFQEIDELDHKILGILSRTPLVSMSGMAKATGVPSTTIDYRMKKLRKRGILIGFQYLINYEALGWTQFPLALYLRRVTPEVKKGLLHFALRSGKITYLAFLLGRWDAELGVRVQHPREISEVLGELNDVLGTDLNRTELYPDFRYHKLEYYPFERLTR